MKKKCETNETDLENLEDTITECAGCKKKKPCRYGPNPFRQDIHGDCSEEWLCKECYDEACDSI